jgi:hypothetical protein
MRPVLAAIRSAQDRARKEGRSITAGEALATLADHFVSVWSASRDRSSWLRAEVLTRNGGCCAVPGCSRAAVHAHHVRFRSRGGTDDAWNQVGLCAWHHLCGIHHGYLTVEGKAGERLLWRLGTGESFVTYGKDDVRRVEEPVVREGRGDGRWLVGCDVGNAA